MNNKLPKLPDALNKILEGYNFEKDNIGCSSSGVYKFFKDTASFYLKIDNSAGELQREYEMLQWLNKELPVPEIIVWCEHGGLSYMLMTEVMGHMTCSCPDDDVCDPKENTIRLLAEGLLMLQSIDISSCPFNNTLDKKLAAALYNIENNYVDMDDFEEGNDFAAPIDLYNYLIANKPPEELCFTHGDYCLPNIFIDDNKVTGFIDWGRGGIADKWQDIALCVRSLGYNLRNSVEKEKYVDLLFSFMNIRPDWVKINYYILLDELF
jgi:kanamycin kinase/aminoglycoside 3'-phosphotransferase-3